MKINGIEFLIGADPEFFVQRGGQVISAHGMLEGTKEAPTPVTHGAVQVDGMALEFNIDPAATFEEFDRNIVEVMRQIQDMVPDVSPYVQNTDALGEILRSVADFTPEYLSSVPEFASQLGCSPDFNAYTRAANPTPNAQTPFRTASGHVHIGWTSDVDPSDEGHLEACYTLTKYLDKHLGIPSLSWDNEDRRRELYGRAGAFRPKSYGMEYRVLSNKWVTNPLLRKLVYYNTIEAIKEAFAEPDRAGSAVYEDLSPASIINKENDNWKEAAITTMRWLGVRSPRWYRNNPVEG